VRVGGNARLARHRLHRFLSWCIELLTLAGTVDTWWPEINAFVTTGITNAQPASQTGQAGRLRIPESRQLGAPDTIPLHPTAGRNPDLTLIARSQSTS
jgi:hypothetical protein